MLSIKPDGTVNNSGYRIADGVNVKQLNLNWQYSLVSALTDEGKIYAAMGADANGSTGWALINNGPFIAVHGSNTYDKDWQGASLAAGVTNTYGITADGTLYQMSVNTNALGLVPSVSTGEIGVKEVTTTAFGNPKESVDYALRSDGSAVICGGLRSNSTPESFIAPAGDKFKQIGGTYKYAYFLTESGRVFVHGFLPVDLQPLIGPVNTDGSTLCEIAVPKPVDSLSMQQTSPGGYAGGFIIPD